ncbi:heparin lyase I family protein [Streptomyces violens]|uniref:heparin lyase I family protein n=1 Tax=Streptomyces violens TaxID=66377 RepID=UPI0004BE9048|nr:heparin lyase I family protein [Streptomyces violens]
MSRLPKYLIPVGAAAVLAIAWGATSSLGTTGPSPHHAASPSPSRSHSNAAATEAGSLLWDGDASHGLEVFGTTLCEAPGSVTVDDWGTSRGKIFKFNKPIGVPRCEAHNVKTDGGEYPFADGKTYWFGWDSMTKTGDAQTVFQWKSNGTNDENSQNYPVLMKVEDGKLKVWYVAPGEEWIPIGTAPWSAGQWHSIQLGIATSSSSSGTLSVYLDGKQITSRQGARTWDDKGNKPRWGTYWGTDDSTASINWIDGLKMGTTRTDVD